MEFEGTLMNDLFTKEKKEEAAKEEASYQAIYERNSNIVWHICVTFLKNPHDAEDALQETFLKLIQSEKKFESAEHEKAWLIVPASNLCKDALKKWWRRTEDIDDPALGLQQPPFEIGVVLDAIMNLPADQKCAVYMYYYEGYSTADIAGYLNCPQATVRSRLSRARKTLKFKLGGDF